MGLRNVVKVMNFHALLRVDKSRRTARKYWEMEEMVISMLDQIANNRNISLDMSVFKFPANAPKLHIYLGGDMGFCGNLNNLVKARSTEHSKEESNLEKIVIGNKMKSIEDDGVILRLTRDEFARDPSQVLDLLEDAVRNKKYSEIRLIYNEYKNASEITFVDKVILPLPKDVIGEKAYTEDFVWEGNPQTMLLDLLILYLQYEIKIASYVSVAAENLTRQSVTTESLKKIDELDEEKARVELRKKKDEEFAKVLDNFTRLRDY